MWFWKSEDLHRGKMVNGVDFTLRKGEIPVLQGWWEPAGQETMLTVYGADKSKRNSSAGRKAIQSKISD